MRQHASDTPSYLLSRLALVLTARDREVTRVARALGNTNTPLLLQMGASTTLLTRDVSNLLSTPQSTTSSNSAVTTLIDTVNRLAGLNRTRGRSAYEVAKRDIGSIRRLRVTKGICLPADTPIHLVCGSKDVIHSWAIPGLGVKIDCIPGYNSHRRVLFRWRGIYWGQCMEVCGRYHHWMPILVRIVHRDAFLSWCLTYLRTLNSRSVSTVKSAQLTGATLRWLQDTENLAEYEAMLTYYQSTHNLSHRSAFLEACIHHA